MSHPRTLRSLAPSSGDYSACRVARRSTPQRRLEEAAKRHPDTPSAGPQIPRSEWAAHPHYPSQVLLLGSHESLRQVSRRLIREAESGRSGRERSAIEGLYRRWIGGMRGHVLVAALRNHDDVLGAHLDLEEELVIPCLLALTPDELDDYCRLPASVLLLRLDSHDRARFAGSVLDGPFREPG